MRNPPVFPQRGLALLTRLLTVALAAGYFSGCGTQINTLKEAASSGADAFGASGVSPSVTSLAILDGSPTNASPLALDWGIVVGVPTHYCLLENSADPALCVWRTGALPTTYADSAGDGPLVLTGFLRNAFGTSASVDSNSVTIDRTAPSLASASITNPNPTNSATYGLAYGAIVNAPYVEYCILENDTAIADCVWTSGALPASFAVSALEGSKDLSVWIRDAVGNASGRIAAGSVYYDPSLPTVTITNPIVGAPINAGNAANVVLNGTCTENTRDVVLSGSASGTATCTGGSWSFNLDLTAVADGAVAFAVDHADAAGNAAVQATRGFAKDVVAPTLVSVSIAGGAATTSDVTPDLALAATGATEMYVTNVAGCASGGAWEPYAPAKTDWALDAAQLNSSASVYAKFRDAAGNESTCASDTIVHDDEAPADPTSLAWSVASPVTVFSLTATWVRSASADLASQTIQFYSDGSCTTTLGAPVALSAASQSRALTAPGTGSYAYILTSVDTTGNEDASPCSSAMVVQEPLVLTPGDFAFPVGAALSQTFAGVGGAGGYTYAVISGPGAIDPTTGAYTASVGSRSVGGTTVVRVTDSASNTATSTITHARLAVNGTVRAAVTDGTSLYVGGDFTEVNPESAYGYMTVSKTNGELLDRGIASRFNGIVYAVAVSGSTAYVGGEFTRYGVQTANNLAKIDLATGSLDTTFTQSLGPSMRVRALALHGGYLYLGGQFTSYRGNSKGSRLARVDPTTGTLDTTTFNTVTAQLNNSVNALVLHGGSLYIAGDFTSYRGSANAVRIAKVDPETGAMDTTFNAAASGAPSSVSALASDGTSLYVGGAFANYRGDARGAYLAKIDPATGALDTASFNASQGPNATVRALAYSGGSLYVGGDQTNYRGDAKGAYLAKIDPATGALETTSFNTLATALNGGVSAIAVDGADLYIGGTFTRYRGDSRGRHLAKLDAATGALETANFNTAARGPSGDVVKTLVATPTALHVGGGFVAYRGTPAPYLAKVNLGDWTVDATFTQSTGPDDSVHALALDGTDLYVGGDFTTYRGDNRGYRLAKLDTVTGALETTNFNTGAGSGPDGQVLSLLASGGSLYVGGAFTAYRTAGAGAFLAKVDKSTGAMDTGFNSAAGPNGGVRAIVADGTHLYAGGDFTSYRGSGNGARLAKIDAATGALETTSFNTAVGPGPTGFVTSLVLSGGYLYVGGAFTTYRTDAKGFNLAKVDAVSGNLETANFNTGGGPANGGAVLALALSGAALYVGGSYTTYRTDAAGKYLTKVDAATGVMDAAFNSTVTTYTTASNEMAIRALAPTAASLAVGGSYSLYRGNPGSPYLAPLDLATGAEE